MLEVLETITLIRVQSWMIPAAPPSVEKELGVSWPMSVGAVVRGKVELLCIGPTEWLLLSEQAGEAARWMGLLAQGFRDTPFRATDLSAGLVQIQVSGPHARSLLSKGTGVDLHPNSFAPDRCARIRFAGMPVVIRCIDNDVFKCIVTASYQQYLWDWLADAEVEFAVAREAGA